MTQGDRRQETGRELGCLVSGGLFVIAIYQAAMIGCGPSYCMI